MTAPRNPAQVRELWAILLDALLGARCESCRIRVFPADVKAHWWADHGDEAA